MKQIEKFATPFDVIRVGQTNFSLAYNSLTGSCSKPSSDLLGDFYPLYIGDKHLKIYISNKDIVEKIFVEDYEEGN